jgi:hypothetical protein
MVEDGIGRARGKMLQRVLEEWKDVLKVSYLMRETG